MSYHSRIAEEYEAKSKHRTIIVKIRGHYDGDIVSISTGALAIIRHITMAYYLPYTMMKEYADHVIKCEYLVHEALTNVNDIYDEYVASLNPVSENENENENMEDKWWSIDQYRETSDTMLTNKIILKNNYMPNIRWYDNIQYHTSCWTQDIFDVWVIIQRDRINLAILRCVSLPHDIVRLIVEFLHI